MRYRRIVLGVLLGALSLSLQACASHPADQEAYVKDALKQFTATVTAVDAANRLVTLAAPSGQRQVFEVGPEVRNFDRVAVGDHVAVSYYVGLVATIEPRGTAAKETEDTVEGSRAPPGTRPAAAIAHARSATVTVDSVDTSFNTMTFRKADGVVRTVAIEDPEAQKALRKLKSGDAVKVDYTEAVAVQVQPVPH
ncbi:MAG TPA: hypothetical protein VGM84_13870 [Steroidobacteraceae bacterium]|jgi:hypothetical protein